MTKLISGHKQFICRVRIQEQEPVALTLLTQAEISKDVTLDMVDDIILSESYNIVKEVTSEFVNEYLKNRVIHDNVDGLIDELSDEVIRHDVSTERLSIPQSLL